MHRTLFVVPTIPVTDIQRARGFYEGLLQLTPLDMVPPFGVLSYQVEGTSIMTIFQREKASSGEHTIANFYIEGLKSFADDLIQRGAKPERFDLPEGGGEFDERGLICINGEPQALFLRDPDGNWLAFSEASDSVHDLLKSSRRG